MAFSLHPLIKIDTSLYTPTMSKTAHLGQAHRGWSVAQNIQYLRLARRYGVTMATYLIGIRHGTLGATTREELKYTVGRLSVPFSYRYVGTPGLRWIQARRRIRFWFGRQARRVYYNFWDKAYAARDMALGAAGGAAWGLPAMLLTGDITGLLAGGFLGYKVGSNAINTVRKLRALNAVRQQMGGKWKWLILGSIFGNWNIVQRMKLWGWEKLLFVNLAIAKWIQNVYFPIYLSMLWGMGAAGYYYGAPLFGWMGDSYAAAGVPPAIAKGLTSFVPAVLSAFAFRQGWYWSALKGTTKAAVGLASAGLGGAARGVKAIERKIMPRQLLQHVPTAVPAERVPVARAYADPVYEATPYADPVYEARAYADPVYKAIPKTQIIAAVKTAFHKSFEKAARGARAPKVTRISPKGKVTQLAPAQLQAKVKPAVRRVTKLSAARKTMLAGGMQ